MPENRPEALAKETLVEALRRAGSRKATMERIEADIAAGAPVNPDGTMNMVRYVAWMLKEDSDDDGQH